MKILIIGSKGFIGMSLTDYLRSKGHEIIESDIVHEYGNNNYIQLDPNASDYEFDQLFDGNFFDACINCSGAADVSKSFKNSLHDYRLNTVNVYRMLNALKTHNPTCKFITLSSAAVYGNPEVLPINEEHSINPLSPYGFHKSQSEQICAYYNKSFGVNSTVLRVFSAYGPHLRKQMFWDFYQKYLNSTGEIELFGSGEETRDFVFIDDICNVVELVVMSNIKGFNVLNVGSGIESRIKDVAAEFFRQLDYTGKVKFTQESLPGYPSQWVADISQIEKLGFKSSTSLADGISKYLKWIKSI